MFFGKIIFYYFSLVLIPTLCIAQDLSIRPKNFIVTPSTGPVCEIVVRNNDKSEYKGMITPKFMKGWKVAPLSQEVQLKAAETKTLPFAIEFGTDLTANSYPVTVTAVSGEKKTELKAQVVCASSPYYKPDIDGKLDEWTDAIPITFDTNGKKTIVRSYWNKDFFYLAVEVEEDRLIGLADADNEKGMDAIQFALSPKDGDPAQRHEYLAAASASMWSGDKCYLLTMEGKPTVKDNLDDMALQGAEVKVIRSGNVTTYEVAVPMKPMKNLRATAGREYCFNLLVHDPDETGVRDLGSVMNLWRDQRKKESWSDWPFVKWNGYVPCDIGIEFGFCSSIH